MNPNPTGATTPTAAPPIPISIASTKDEECSNCGTKKGWVLHNVRYRGSLRRLCTSCVLRLHPSSFCPQCFLSHASIDSSNPNHQNPNPTSQNPQTTLVPCSKCPSLSHPDCLPPYAAFSPSPFLCPPCASPNPATFSFFNLENRRGATLDKRLAGVLVCAAGIAAGSMFKAVGAARADADRKVREAANARKRAREALERFVLLSGGGGKAAAAVGKSNGGANGGGNARAEL